MAQGEVIAATAFLRSQGVIGDRAEDRKGYTSAQILQMARERGFGDKIRGVSKEGDVRASKYTRVVRDDSGTLQIKTAEGTIQATDREATVEDIGGSKQVIVVQQPQRDTKGLSPADRVIQANKQAAAAEKAKQNIIKSGERTLYTDTLVYDYVHPGSEQYRPEYQKQGVPLTPGAREEIFQKSIQFSPQSSVQETSQSFLNVNQVLGDNENKSAKDSFNLSYDLPSGNSSSGNTTQNYSRNTVLNYSSDNVGNNYNLFKSLVSKKTSKERYWTDLALETGALVTKKVVSPAKGVMKLSYSSNAVKIFFSEKDIKRYGLSRRPIIDIGQDELLRINGKFYEDSDIQATAVTSGVLTASLFAPIVGTVAVGGFVAYTGYEVLKDPTPETVSDFAVALVAPKVGEYAGKGFGFVSDLYTKGFKGTRLGYFLDENYPLRADKILVAEKVAQILQGEPTNARVEIPKDPVKKSILFFGKDTGAILGGSRSIEAQGIKLTRYKAGLEPADIDLLYPSVDIANVRAQEITANLNKQFGKGRFQVKQIQPGAEVQNAQITDLLKGDHYDIVAESVPFREIDGFKVLKIERQVYKKGEALRNPERAYRTFDPKNREVKKDFTDFIDIVKARVSSNLQGVDFLKSAAKGQYTTFNVYTSLPSQGYSALTKYAGVGALLKKTAFQQEKPYKYPGKDIVKGYEIYPTKTVKNYNYRKNPNYYVPKVPGNYAYKKNDSYYVPNLSYSVDYTPPQQPYKPNEYYYRYAPRYASKYKPKENYYPGFESGKETKKTTTFSFDSSDEKLTEGFDVFVRTRGKFRKVNRDALDKITALSIGARVASGSAAATFKIQKSNKAARNVRDLFYERMASRFRTKVSKKGDVLFIEKNRFRINTPGELQEITFKGINAQTKGLF